MRDGRVTILNVDDDPAGRRQTTRFLRKAGYEVVEAGTGGDALRLAGEGPDLIVLDVNLPDISGLEVSRRLKASASTRRIPVLQIAEIEGEDDQLALGLESGADGYLARPADPPVLLATVRALLRAQRAEAELLISGQRWEATFDAISDPLCLLDADGRIIRGNAAMISLLEQPPHAILGRTVREVFGEGDAEGPDFDELRAANRRLTRELRYRDRWYRVALDPIQGPTGSVDGAVRTMTDITAERRAEASLREIDQARQAIFRASPLAIIVFDLVGNIEAWSPAAESILGWSAEEVVGKPYPAVPAEKQEEFQQELARTLRGEGFSSLETWRERRDKSRVDVNVWAAPLRDASGELRGAIHVLADVTERRRIDAERERLVRDLAAYGAENARLLRLEEEGRTRAEAARAALAESEALYRAIGESIAYGVWVADPDGSMRFLSKSFLELTGLSMDEARDVGWMTRLAPEDRDRTREDWFRTVQAGGEWDYELRILGRDGAFRTILSRGSPVTGPDGRLAGFAGINLDVTSRVRATRALAFLSEASTLLASTLEHESILDNLAHLAVPALADWCAVDIVQQDGSLGRVGAAHRDPGGSELLLEMERRYPASTAQDRRLAVVRSGRSELIEAVDEEMRARWALDADHAALLRRIGIESAMLVPLVARSRTLGVLSLGIARPGRRFDHDDLALAEEMARRAALAIDNARLFAAERSARSQAQDVQTRLALVVRAERARAAELNAVIRAFGDAVVVADASGQVLLLNPAANSLIGHRPVRTLAELFGPFRQGDHRSVEVGETLAAANRGHDVELLLPGDPDRWLDLKTYRVDESSGAANSADTADGEDIWPSGEIATSILVLRDVTASRRAHILREAFIGMLSHELRTPITTIYAGTKVLARPPERVSEETRREVYRDLEAEAERLYRLVEDLLVLSRAEGGAIEIGSEPLLLQHVLSEVVRTEGDRWPSARFALDIPPGLPAVMADRTYVEQVVRNLLSNAAKYSPEGAEIVVCAEATEDEVRVMVRDEGVGLQPEEVGQLFELFYRSPSTSSKVGGAGIGLFVTRQLVEAMGGRIWAQPRPAGGAEFGFSLRAMGDDDA